MQHFFKIFVRQSVGLGLTQVNTVTADNVFKDNTKTKKTSRLPINKPIFMHHQKWFNQLSSTNPTKHTKSIGKKKGAPMPGSWHQIDLLTGHTFIRNSETIWANFVNNLQCQTKNPYTAIACQYYRCMHSLKQI